MADVLNAAAEALRDPISLKYGRGGMSAKFDAIDLLRALRAAGFDVVPTTEAPCTTTTSAATGDATPPPNAESATTTPEGIPARPFGVTAEFAQGRPLVVEMIGFALAIGIGPNLADIFDAIELWEPRIRRVVEAEIDERIRTMFGWVEERNGQPASDR